MKMPLRGEEAAAPTTTPTEQYLLWGMPGVAYDQAFSPFSKAFCKCAVRPIRVTSGLTKKRAYEMPEF